MVNFGKNNVWLEYVFNVHFIMQKVKLAIYKYDFFLSGIFKYFLAAFNFYKLYNKPHFIVQIIPAQILSQSSKF